MIRTEVSVHNRRQSSSSSRGRRKVPDNLVTKNSLALTGQGVPTTGTALLKGFAREILGLLSLPQQTCSCLGSGHAQGSPELSLKNEVHGKIVKP